MSPSSIDLFSVQFQPGIGEAPLNLICQALDVDGEKLVWIDGLNPDCPLMAPIAALTKIEWLGSIGDFMRSRMEISAQVIDYTQGDFSPTIMARAIAAMEADSSLNVEDAVMLVEGQGLDLLDKDSIAASIFQQVFLRDEVSVS